MYKEKIDAGNMYRENYIESIEKMIGDLQKKADEKRYSFFKEMANNSEVYRNELIKMLGWPLTEYDYNVPQAKKELVTTDGTTNIYRITLDTNIGIKFYGMFFEHNDKGKLPLVIAQHGALGTPEACSGLLESGSGNYNDMVMRVYDKGVNVFAPQLLLWDQERYSIEYNREDIDAKLKQLGSSITAVEIYNIRKSIDYLSTLDCVDETRIGMVGLSYGGFYTLFTTAVDTRIKTAVACSQYNNRYKYSRTDWTWLNSANKFLDNEVISLVYPRYLCVLVGDRDEVFVSKPAELEYEKLKDMFDDNWMDFYVFEGKHEFIKDDKYIDKFLTVLKK